MDKKPVSVRQLELEKENLLLQIQLQQKKQRKQEKKESEERMRTMKLKLIELINIKMKKGEDVSDLIAKTRELNRETRLRREGHRNTKDLLEEKERLISQLRKKLEAKLKTKEEKLARKEEIRLKIQDYEAKLVEYKKEADALVEQINLLPCCKYCSETAVAYRKERAPICGKSECREKNKKMCNVKLECGHFCYGVHGETDHLPCLEEGCAKDGQGVDDPCIICFDSFSAEACIQHQKCGNIFHLDCITSNMEANVPKPGVIKFKALKCPLCADQLTNEHLDKHPIAIKLNEWRTKVDILIDGRVDELNDREQVKNPHGLYYNNPKLFAKDNLEFFSCFECNEIYCGGDKICRVGEEDEEMVVDEKDLLCNDCSCKKVNAAARCSVHGTDFLHYKCKFCCSAAIWFCGGTTHFCDPCHRHGWGAVIKPCPGPDACYLKGKHIPNGNEYMIGCGLCVK